ncbi:FAD/NAD(P)-binding domain-containing protein [Thozetella sp. PMI_491]|nr:FAD/NAD(P)-binding domain-containing protein [Thozetella sp. PMI_491]
MAPPLKVLVCGGGLAGPSLALWLTRVGCEVTVIERTGELRASGQQIDIRGQAVEVMRRMGIEAAIRANLVDEPGLQFVNEAGRRIAYFGANKSGKGRQSMTSEFEIMRGDFCHILHDATKATTKWVFGVHVVDFEQLSGDQGVRVQLSDGTSDTYDLLVGADGQGSKMRKLMLSKSGLEDNPKIVHVNLAWYSIPAQDGDTNIATAMLSPNRRFTITRKDSPETLRVYYMTSSTSMADDHPMQQAIRNGTIEEQKKAWADHFRSAGYRAARFNEGMDTPEADDFYSCEALQVKLDTYSHGRVVLVGDAGMCASPLSGMGTAIGLVTAYCLAGEIAKHCQLRADGQPGEAGAPDPREGLAAALKAYDESLRPFINKVQELPPGAPDYWMPKSSWYISVWHWFLWFVATFGLDKLLSKLASDDVAGWTLPDYPELGRVEVS